MPRRRKYSPVDGYDLGLLLPWDNFHLLVWIGRGDCEPATLARRLGEPIERTAARITVFSEHGLVDVSPDGTCRLSWRADFAESGGRFRIDFVFSTGCELTINLTSDAVVSREPR